MLMLPTHTCMPKTKSRIAVCLSQNKFTRLNKNEIRENLHMKDGNFVTKGICKSVIKHQDFFLMNYKSLIQIVYAAAA